MRRSNGKAGRVWGRRKPRRRVGGHDGLALALEGARPSVVAIALLLMMSTI
jgi:hypothetical protein